MSNHGSIGATFIFLEGLNSTPWKKMPRKIASLQNNVAKAVSEMHDWQPAGYVCGADKLKHGKIFDGNNIIEFISFTMNEANDSFRGGGCIQTKLCELEMPDYQGDENLGNDDYSDVYREICRRWHCCVDVHWQCEAGAGAYCRKIIDIYGDILWQGEHAVYTNVPRDLLINPTWKDVISANYFWMKHNVDEEKRNKAKKKEK